MPEEQIQVSIDGTGRALRFTSPDRRALRLKLAAIGVRFRLRTDEGGLLADPWEAVKILESDLAINWSPQARRVVDNRVRVARGVDRVRDAHATVRTGGPAVARAMIADGALSPQLDDHQAANVAMLTATGTWGGCVFDEQGTGKTLTMIATFDLLVERRLTETLLVVAPKTMVSEWREEFAKFAGDLYRVEVADGDRWAKADALTRGADVIVMNFEALVALDDEIIRLARRTRLCIAVDESFNVKNADASRTRAAVKVREWCTHAFVLCGTPAPNSAADVVAQFDLVDFGWTFSGLRLDKDKDVAAHQVARQLDARGLFVRNVKAVVLPGLPNKSFTQIEVDLAPQQQAAYDAALRDLIIDLEKTDDNTFARQIQSFLERRATLLRICADPSPIVPGYSETPAKISALDELISHLVKDLGEKVIVWSFFRSSLDRIAKRYASFGLVRIDGSVTNASERRLAVRRFQSDPDVYIFLGNPAAAGAGLNLHSSRYAVYESVSNQAAHFLQSIDRIHRRGQQRDVHYVMLVARDTIEELEYARLRLKADAQADLLGDPPSHTPSRRVMLDELIRAHRVSR